MKTKCYLSLIIILLSISYTYPQNTTITPQGVMFPQMSTTQINALIGQAKGTMVFDNSLNQMKYWDGTVWQAMSNMGSGGAWQSSGSNVVSTNAGNVGIGELNPAYKLDILYDNQYSNLYGMRLKSSSGSSVIQLEGANSDASLVFGTNATHRWAINAFDDEFNIAGGNTALQIDHDKSIVTLVKGAKIGYNGSTLGNFLYGTTALGSSINNTYSQPVFFPYSLPNANYIVTFSQSGTSFDDFFQLQVRDKTVNGFTIWAKRRDSNTGWGQILNVDWIVMSP